MEKETIVFKGSHPDSLYRVATDSNASASKVTRVLRVLRWPVALIAVCIALAVFVYFLMPDNLESRSDNENGTYWEPVRTAGHSRDNYKKKPENNNAHGTKTSEIDFYAAENDKKHDSASVSDSIIDSNYKRKLIPPIFPSHLTPEVQYGNEKADLDNLRSPKKLEEDATSDDSTLKPHITQKPEKPLAIYLKPEAITTETIARAETINDFTLDEQKTTMKKIEKTHPSAYKEYVIRDPNDYSGGGPAVPIEVEEFYVHHPAHANFTSGHSKLFGISIEDAERMKSTTQSSLYNTRVSPTLPTWRDGDDTTTKNYPTNIYSEVQCRSTRLSLCRGVLPYDLAGAPAMVGNVEITSLLSQIDYLVATNCSDRVRHFVCALLEPECNPPPYPVKMPCYNLCKAIVDSCDGQIPTELIPAFNCKKYSRTKCVSAKTPCYSREFTCSDGACVPRDWICDGTKDCPAGEDEATCIQCDQSEYRCSSGGCILKRWLCDGYTDCPSGEDEHEATCGPRDGAVISETHEAHELHEPGEESAGSAPAPAVRRPNRVPTGRKTNHHVNSENENSKELLVTSDSSNGLKRNFTRRPSPTRLSPYHRPSTRRTMPDSKEDSTERSLKKSDSKKPVGEKTTQKSVLDNESIEDVNMGDLGFFDEFEKDSKANVHNSEQKAPQRLKPTVYAVPPPNQTALRAVIQPATQTTHLDKSINKLDRVIDGAALLRKAAAAQASYSDIADMNTTYVDRDEMPPAGGNGPAANTRNSGGMSAGRAVGTGAPAAGGADGGIRAAGPDNTASGAQTWGPGGNRNTYSGSMDWSRAHASPCPSGELRCVDGRCITLAQLCDGTIDCSDHADEDNCYT